MLQTISDLGDLKYYVKKLFMRADFNVSLNNGMIGQDYRIRMTIPTIEYLTKRGAKLILISHLDRPTHHDINYSLEPVARRLSEIMPANNVRFAADCIGTVAQKAIDEMNMGDITLLENLRFHKEEETNDSEFSKKIASLADVDFTKHMNKILEIGTDYVLVQPGLVKGILDKELKKRGKFLPPDPASSNYCTIGGMIANNSSGVHALGYGSTIEFLDMVNVVYSDGSFGSVSNNNTSSSDKEPEKIAKLYRLLSPQIELIQKQYPKVTKNSCGYRLDAVINNEKFYPHKIFAASEGTLGIVTSAKLKIIDIPLYRATIVFGFKDLLSAISAVPLALQFSPVALEMLDHTVFRNLDVETYPRVMDSGSDDGSLLFVEFAGDSIIDVEQKLTSCKDKLSSVSTILETVTDENSSRQIWGARKSALNNAMKMTVGSRKPVGLIEDTVVSPDILYDYTRFLLQKYNDNKLDYVIYGHAGNGNLHTRPMIDTESQSELELFNIVADEVFTKVISCGGTITGEHGDGIARTKYIEFMYGLQIVSIFEQIKKLFDPKFIMNPGKKVIRSDV